MTTNWLGPGGSSKYIFTFPKIFPLTLALGACAPLAPPPPRLDTPLPKIPNREAIAKQPFPVSSPLSEQNIIKGKLLPSLSTVNEQEDIFQNVEMCLNKKTTGILKTAHFIKVWYVKK